MKIYCQQIIFSDFTITFAGVSNHFFILEISPYEKKCDIIDGLQYDGSTKTINSRDGIIELVDQYHYDENKGNEEAGIIVFYVGTKESQLSEGRSDGVLLPKTQQ